MHYSHGTLTVRLGVLAPCIAYDVLAFGANRPLAQVMKALAQILVQPLGVHALVRAHPDYKFHDFLDSEATRQLLQTWVVQFDGSTHRFQGFETDQIVIWDLAKLMQSLRHHATKDADLGPLDLDAERKTLRWLTCFIDDSVAGRGGPGEAVRHRLADFGVMLPKGTAQGIELAVLVRLVEAEQSSETDIFTGELLISDGRAAKGLAAIIRPGEGSKGRTVYVQLYDNRGIYRWIAEHGFDPTTREQINVADILPLTVQQPPSTACCFPVGIFAFLNSACGKALCRGSFVSRN